ncbi:MAG: L-histidine N(alpha)-methyltransferase [Burkholderiales bacterium]|nr:L-histidine N(alpha)-methyltransferase [Burkholderiales bacterium]
MDELKRGLLASDAWIAPKFFYDLLGSRLFAAITALPEYYPPRVEAEILTTYRKEIAQALGTRATLIDLGAGNCEKVAGLFPILQPAQYVAVDISVDFLRDALDHLSRQYPDTDMVGVGVDFSTQLNLPADVSDKRRTFFYLGSSIGNFPAAEAVPLLERLRRNMGAEGGLLIGMDLVKPIATLEAAYDDALGVTAAFNRNVLLHINRILVSDFKLEDWRHVALFNPQASRIEMHLEALREVRVTWPGGERLFAAQERIHTENSYKYTPESARTLLQQAGFMAKQVWTDPMGYFALIYATPSRV